MSGKKKSRRRAQHLDLVVCPGRFRFKCHNKHCTHLKPHKREPSCNLGCSLQAKLGRSVKACVSLRSLNNNQLIALIGQEL